MAKQRTDTESVINLVINGKQAMSSLGQLTDAQRRLTSEMRHMSEIDPRYPQQLRELQAINTALSQRRNEMRGVVEEQEKVKTSLEDIAKIAIGNVIADGFQSALGAVNEFIAGSEAAYEEAEKGQAQLQAVLKSTGGISGKTKDQLDALSGSIMNLTGVDDDVITKSESLLLTFTNIRGEIFDQTLPAIVDMTAAMNSGNVSMETIQATTIQVGKALNDPIKGMTALSKVGVSFTAEQKKTVKQMVATNDIAGAQKLILAELGKEFGGVSQAMAETESGSLTKMQTRLGNIQETLGGYLTSLKAATAKGLEPFLEKVERWIAIPSAEKIREEEAGLNGLVSAIVMTNDNQTVRNSLIAQLQAKYPDFLGNINAEAASNELLTRRLTEANDQYRQRIFIASNEDDIKLIQEKRNTAIREEVKARKEVAKASGLSATELAKLTDQEIRQMAIKIKNDALDRDRSRGSTGGNAYSAGTSNSQNKEIKNLEIILNGRSRIAQSFKDEADLMGANAVMQQKVTDQRVKDIDLEITKLKQLKGDKKILSEIERLTSEKNGLLGIAKIAKPSGGGAPPKTKGVSDADKAKKEYETLGEEYKKLGVQQLADQMSKDLKEVEQEGWKYNELIKKEQDFIKLKGATQKQKADAQSKIDQLEKDKKTAQTAISVRQEADRTKAIEDFRLKLSQKLETELQKEQDLINQQYDALEKDASGNADAVAKLKIARAKDLTDAEIREMQRLEDEKKRISRESTQLNPDTHAAKLATINKQYDEELAALKKSFSDKAEATREYQDLVADIEKNRTKAIKGIDSNSDKEKAKDKETRDAVLQSAQAVSDAVFTIAANNRKRETDIALNELDRQRQGELANKNLTDKQKEQINAKYDAKVKAEKLKAWQADKRAALAQAVISGALAVVKALPNVALAIASGIAAAAQIAVIVAQKPPEFAVGVKDFEGGPAIVGEKGAELINENGKMWLATSRTMANLPKGTDVYTASQTSGILANTMYPSKGYALDSQAALSAERNYRFNAGSNTQLSSSVIGSSGSSAKESSDMALLIEKFDQMILAQKEANDKKVSMVYSEFEAFQNDVVKTRYSQGE
jgi:hypothetical protein